MKRCRSIFSLIVLFSLFFALLPSNTRVNAGDLAPTESVGGGASIYVFRGSSKKPQERAGGRANLEGSGSSRAREGRSGAQIAAVAKKRRANAVAARKKAAVTAASQKLALSNTLTTKAEGFLDNNQTDLAIKNYRDALVQNPKNARASEGLSNALTAKGIDVAGENNAIASAVFFEEAVKLDKTNDVAFAKLGAVYDANNQNDKAIANYEKALSLNPEYSTLHAPLGLAYLDAGDLAKAEASLQKSEDAGLDAAESRLTRGIIQFKQNKDTEALASFDKAIELDPKLGPAHYYRGQVLDRLKREADALAAFRQTLEIDRAFGPAAYELGVSYYNQGDYQNALASYQEAVKLEPENYQAHANLASTYRQLERYSEANAEYQIASTGIKTADLYSEWGYCLGKTKEWDKSTEKLATAKEMSPTAVDNSNLGWAYYNDATAQKAAKNDAEATKKYSLAKQALEVAVQLDPKLDAAYLNLGSTHNGLGEFQAAIQILNTVLSLNKNWAIAVNQLGVGYRGVGDFKNAIASFKRIADSDGRNTFSLYNLGEAYYASGNKNEAKKINDKLKKLDPTLAAALDNVIAGKVIDAATQKVQQKVPIRLPRIP
jgi:tetratricopeptide (TPR) repeat protein